MKDPGMIIAPLAVIAVALAATAIGFARAWVQAREREVRLRGEIERLRHFAQFEHGLDAVAVEVERLGEMQRLFAPAATYPG